jgi:F-type H+-transporting ATPase subunit delta
MLKGAVARRYAGAIFDLARKQNTLDRTLEDVQAIARLFANRKLAYLLREPRVPAQRKETAIRQGLQFKVLPTSLNLALLVVQRGLVDVMSNIAAELEQLVLDYKNEARAQVTTAEPMDEEQHALMQDALEQRTGKTIIMETRTDPDILGGVIARVGDQVIDGSVRYRLSALRQRLLSGVSGATIDMFADEPAEAERELETAPPDSAHPGDKNDGYNPTQDVKPSAYRS